jgi:hypothetical protein
MTDTESLRRAVEADPDALERRFGEVQSGLESEDTRRRIDAGRALREAAKHDPALVEPHRQLLLDHLPDSNDSVTLSATVGLAELADRDPAAVGEAVPDLTDVLSETQAPSIEEAAIRALKRVGEWSPEVVASADEVLGEKLRGATPPIRVVMVSFFPDAVVADPLQFPATVDAMETALTEDDNAAVRKHAAVALSHVATADESAVSSPEKVVQAVEAIEAKERAKPMYEGESVGEAADRLRAVYGG